LAQILIVHGVGYQFSGEQQVQQAYAPALLDGLGLAGRKLELSELGAVCYGDLFHRSGTMAGGLPPLSAGDVEDADESELLSLFWEEAAKTDDAVMPPQAATRARTPQIVQRALNSLSESRFFAGVAERALIFDVKQVARYFSDEGLRRAANERIAAKMTADTRILVAHSLGSVAAYETLCANPQWPVTTFVTIGSPLGIANVIFHKLGPAPRKGKGQWPGSLRRWTNIADKGDVVALKKELAPLFDDRIHDVLVYNGSHAHNATHYLTARETGMAIAEGLGD
jgi:hypothetical protein